MSSSLNRATVQRVKGALQEAFSFPTVKSAKVDNAEQYSAILSYSSIAAKKKVDVSVSVVTNPSVPETPLSQPGIFKSAPTPSEATETLSIHDKEVSVLIMKVKKDDTDADVLHFLRSNRLVNSVNLADWDIHGSVYYDQEFGSISLSPDLSKVVFVAEEKKPKNTPFSKPDKDDDEEKEKDPAKETSFGQEFKFREEFGEQLVGKSRPVIVEVDLSTFKPRVVAFPQADEGWVPGQVVFLDDDYLIGTAFSITPRRLGAIYCSNRPTVIFKMGIQEGSYQVLSSQDNSASYSPRVSPDGQRVVWLQRKLAGVNKLYPGPHQACSGLMMLEDDKVVEVIPIVQTPGSDGFGGLFCTTMPTRPFSKSGRFLLFTNLGRSRTDCIVADLQEKKFEEVSAPEKKGSIRVLDVKDNVVLALYSSGCRPQEVWRTVLEEGKEVGSRLAFKLPASSDTDLPIQTNVYRFPPTMKHPDPRYGNVQNECVLHSPLKWEGPRPLILWPHGGPHGMTTDSFVYQAYFFNALGFAVLFVNYRGSLGLGGNDGVEAIMGHIGTTDVSDCVDALDYALEQHKDTLDPKNVFLCGGSHGGFLVTHLAGQHASRFKGCVASNPVINVASMVGVTDIPDWCCNEGGVSYDGDKSAGPDLLKQLYEKSPVFHAAKIECPVYLLVGKTDLRVPPSQSYEFYHLLKSLGKPVEMCVYEDNHPLAKVDVDTNTMINTAIFFENQMKK